MPLTAYAGISLVDNLVLMANTELFDTSAKITGYLFSDNTGSSSDSSQINTSSPSGSGDQSRGPGAVQQQHVSSLPKKSNPESLLDTTTLPKPAKYESEYLNPEF